MSASDGNQTAHGFGVSAAPLGQVVQSGQEHTGRWTREEHEAFLSALQEYGKEWKKVAAKVKTRTVVQTRTHAQKYFQKLQKGMATGEKIGIGGIEISGGDVKNKSPGDGMNRKKPQASRQSKSQGNFLMTPQERQAAEAAQAAAKLMTQISQVKPRREDPPPSNTFFSAQQPSSDPSITMPASTSTPQYNPTQTFSQVNFVQHVQHPITSTNGNLHQQRVMAFEAPLIQHKTGTGLQNIHSTSTNTQFDSALLNQNQSKKADPPQAQAISSGITFSTALPIPSVQEVPSMNAGFQKASLEQPPTMKIVPPKLNEKMKFPEPSPAACGKRKLMEIAAAQIMAGVAASGVAKKGVRKVDETFSRKETPPPMTGVENESSPLKSNSMSSTFGGLQIVNPEVFGSSLTERRKQGGLSPTTPWDGEMEVLER
jgi:SHAQKYF class myb-like DNA-binding protein